MKLKSVLTLSLLALPALFSCSSDNEGGETPEPKPTPSQKIPINISVPLTRASDTTFDVGDKIGLYVVNRNADGTAAPLATSGNHVTNMCYTYNATWTPDQPVYWQDGTTHADFYLYYPYTASLSSVTAMPFSVKANQSAEANFKAGDFLLGSALDVTPSESAVVINAKHVMSQMLIKLAAGNGFTDATLAAATVNVKINNLKTNATVNLSTAAVSATGSATSITPYHSNGVYKAMVVPQTVGEGNLITITVNGRDFNLSKAFTFVSGKQHQFTVTLSKTSSGVNVNITNWETDNIDNGGTAE